MNVKFILDQRLKDDTIEIIDLTLSKLLLVDNALFPWVILVPKQTSLTEIIDLSEENQQILMKEIALISQMMRELFKPDKLNVAALGNIVKQLHIHIIARFESDKAWPGPAFGQDKINYTEKELERLINSIKSYLNIHN